MSARDEGPRFVRHFPYVIEALQLLGGSARPIEVTDKVAELEGVTPEEREELQPSGSRRFGNEVAWARFYLGKAGYIDTSRRGVWALTDMGRSTSIDHATAVKLFRQTSREFLQVTPDSRVTIQEEELPDVTNSGSVVQHRSDLLRLLMGLSPKGFERFAQRLLREAGFEDVTVTEKSGDGGIDGIGILQVNPLVSFKVLFQCKRYRDNVSPSQVRDFRGAMQGRADKGIILTTGSFSHEARKEAVRDGVPAIELIDGEKLMSMLEDLELGLKPVKAFEIDEKFFSEFG